MDGSLTTSTTQISNEPIWSRARAFSQRAACDAGRTTSEDKTTFDHTAKPMRMSISGEMLTITICTHADRAERPSMVSIRAVVVVILDSRRRTSTEIRYVKTLTIVLVRVFVFGDEMRLRIRCELPV